MFCGHCGRELVAGEAFCRGCGKAAPAAEPAAPPPAHHSATEVIEEFIEEVAEASVKDIALIDRARAAEILKSPAFLFLCLVAVAPLGIQALDGTQSILNGLAVWSGVLWALLLYRLFAAREVPISWCIATVFFTAFIGLPLLQVWVSLPPKLTERLVQSPWLPLHFLGYVFGVGVREELCKALPLFILIRLSRDQIKQPAFGLMLGMMSGVGFAIAENVYYIFHNLEQALGIVRQTGQLVHLVKPVYANVVRMAMTPFFHACLTGIFGYFISQATCFPQRRWAFLVAGLGTAAVLHGLFDTFVDYSPLYGCLILAATFFLLLTYILKARGLSEAHQIGARLFSQEPDRPRPEPPAGRGPTAPTSDSAA